MIPDEILIDRLRSGDAKAMDAIVNKYHRHLCWEARLLLFEKEAAEDVVQDMVVKIWQRNELLRLKEPAALQKFLVVSVRRRCIDENRKYRSKKAVVDAMAFHQEQTIEIEYEGLLERQLVDRLLHNLKTAMKDLTVSRLAVLKKVFFEDMKMKEIAEEMNITEGSVQKYNRRALDDLRDKMLSRR